VATFHSISKEQLIKLHTDSIFKIYFLGFLPGFPYLGGLPKALHTPRRETPRQAIKEGSVAIGGGQAGIYTFPSPGGWHIIGKSPLHFFNVEKSLPVLLQAGDYIQFMEVNKSQMKRIEIEVELGIYHIEKEVYND
jgi:inhibitor of KinA